MKKKKGSMTVFMALSIMLVFSVIFSMLELSRVYGCKANVIACTEQASDGVMASYHPDLWKDYRLLFYEAGEGELPALDQMTAFQKDLIEGNWTDPALPIRNYYLLPVHLQDVEVTGYQLATDGEGAAFRKEAAQMMKASVGEAMLEALLNQANQEEQEEETTAEDSALAALEVLEQGASAKEEAARQSELQTSDGSGQSTESTGLIPVTPEVPTEIQVSPDVHVTRWNNPLQWVKRNQRKGVLGIVMPDKDISAQAFDIKNAPDKRILEHGSMPPETLSAGEEMLFRMYLTTYYKNVMDTREEGAMQYEQEYIVAGKGSDRENLKAVVNRLLLMREAANLAYLETDPVKSEEAFAVAAAITTLFCVPEFEEVARQGVLAAWAYGESLCDVKILLDGGKVNPVKTSDQWHTDLMHMGEAITNAKGSDQAVGLSYENYLSLMMWTMRDGKLSYRAMNVIEQSLHVRMDQMVCSMEGNYVYEAQPLFWKFVTISSRNMDQYQWKVSGGFSYINDE